MTNAEKQVQLRKHKTLATGLFLLMMLVFISMTYFLKSSPENWMNYVRAFSEAAMVGALADWFAVTALFHYPMGMKIPHTNLIENSKQKIGDNLGDFVVDNFLTAENIRPYIVRLDIAKYVAEFLKKEKNKETLSLQFSGYLHKIISNLDDDFVISIIEKKGTDLIQTIKTNELIASGLEYAIDKGMHQQLITFLAAKIKQYIVEHQDIVREKVKEESSVLIPDFIDNIIATKITNGLVKYFGAIEDDLQHQIRRDVATQLKIIVQDIKYKEHWKHDLDKLKEEFLQPQQITKMAQDIWINIKDNLLDGLSKEKSGINIFIQKTVNDIAETLNTDLDLKEKINHWVRLNAYKIVLKNKQALGTLISTTVGKWQGRDLSEKLELEVGKDLQFIRINGTLVGGLVGLLIYVLSQFLF
ncbi:MAG TPA: DUF445 domain-containing protein [Edaphocola sp.]|nr:DUF445 domain-containing protein [Edaphocola sp.]